MIKDKIKVMVNGLPGNMASAVVKNLLLSPDTFDILNYSLTGSETTNNKFEIEGISFLLINLDNRQQKIEEIINEHDSFISVDFTLPHAVVLNSDFYCSNALPFILGTTGGKYNKIESIVSNSVTSAVIAPNMALEIVALQKVLNAFSLENIGRFNKCNLRVSESHQNGKADTSGTAKAIVGYFATMGIDYDLNKIIKMRDPEKQVNIGVPNAFLSGHGWHTYTISSKPEDDILLSNLAKELYNKVYLNNPVFNNYECINMAEDFVELVSDYSLFKMTYEPCKLEITHNINGREVYAKGTLDAIEFLITRIQNSGNVYNMSDVLEELQDIRK